MNIRRFILSTIAFLAVPAFVLSAEEITSYSPDDANLPEDYVSVSVLAAEPGGALYSLAGHIALRMQCPYHNLDYVFSYESENAPKKVLSFLAGKLKMGLVSISPDEYFGTYEKEGRGVKEYKVNMPLSAGQILWRVLDEHLMEGMVPYDYLERGCAQSTLRFLREGLDTIAIEYGPFPEYFNMSRREITGRQIGKFHWTWAFMNLICNKPIDDFCTFESKIIMPADFIEVMSNAKVCGKPFLESPVQVLESKESPKAALFTPFHLSLIILLLTLLCAFMHKDWMQYVLLAVQTLIGGVSTYLVFFSSLCCTQWSWLLVPFNLIPLIFWKWRKYWALPFGIICALWAIAMTFMPHRLTDWPYVILSLSLAISYFTMKNNPVSSTK